MLLFVCSCAGLKSQEIDTTFTYFSRVYLEDSINVVSYAVLPVGDGYFVSGGYAGEGINQTVYLRKLSRIGETEWVKTLDDSPSTKQLLHGTCHIASSDGEYILVYTRSEGLDQPNSRDFVVVKHDEQGDVLWTNAYGSSSAGEVPICVTEAKDGSGYVIAGFRQQLAPLPETHAAAYVIKINESGQQEWERQHSIIDSGNTEVRTIESTFDGGYVIGGAYLDLDESNSDPFVLKLDAEGQYVWHKSYGLDSYDAAGFVKELPDSTLMFMSGHDVGNDFVPFAAKLTSIGDTITTKTYEGQPYESFFLYQENGDGFMVFSYDKNYPPSTPYLVSLDTNLDTLWSKPFSWTSIRDVALKDIEKTPDGGFILCGMSGVGEVPQFSWIFKVDSLGNTCDNLIDCSSAVVDTVYTSDNARLLSSQHFLNISPNPIASVATVSYALPSEGSHAWLRIFDMHGMEVRSLRLSTSSNTRELTIPKQMGSGVYVYVVEVRGRNVLRGNLLVAK